MRLMIQNFGSNPNKSWSTTTAVVIINGFLYLIMDVFIVTNNILHLACTRSCFRFFFNFLN